MQSSTKSKSWLMGFVIMRFGHTAVVDFGNQLRFDEKEYTLLGDQEIDLSSLLSGSKNGEKCGSILSITFCQSDQ